jgi:hypothetical protein
MQVKQVRIRIGRDDCPESPREWGTIGKMVCWHSRYNLGDEQPTTDPSEYLRELAADHVAADYPEDIPDWHIQRILDKYFLILPLYLFDHSGLLMLTSPFSCPWDSGQVGYMIAEKVHAIADCGSEENAIKAMESEVETYSQYLSGDVWHYVIEERDGTNQAWEVVDSCNGFFGSDPEKNGILDYVPDYLHDELIAQVGNII